MCRKKNNILAQNIAIERNGNCKYKERKYCDTLCLTIKSVITNRILALQTDLVGLNLGLNFPFSLALLPGVPSGPGRADRVSGS